MRLAMTLLLLLLTLAGGEARAGRVRITKMTSQFMVEYISRKKTGVVYTSRADPGGSLPTFLVNHGSKDSLKDNAGIRLSGYVG